MSSNDEGYGKPPKKNQFQKGKSGNPKGRPKGSSSLEAVLQTMFDKKVAMVMNGKPEKVPLIQALATKVVAMAMTGNHAALKMAFDLYSTANPAVNDNQPLITGSSFELTPDELAVIKKSNLLKGIK